MAEERIYPKGAVKQTEEFAETIKLKNDVYEAIKKSLEDTTVKAFKDVGYEHAKGYAGEYGDGSVYGAGVGKDEGKFNVKVGSKTESYLEKQISLGGKRAISEIHMDVDPENKVLNMTYKTRETGLFRGLNYTSKLQTKNDKKGGFMIDDEYSFKLDSMPAFKKALKKQMAINSEKEAGYITKTKLGVQDRVQLPIDGSIVENIMKKLTIKDILSSSFDEFDSTMNSIEESKKADLNHPEVIDANSPGNLLFDDLEEAESKNGKEYRDFFEKEMKKFGAKSPKELKPSEWTTINMGWESKEEKGLEEINVSGGIGAGGRYDAPGAFALGGDFDKELKMQKENFNNTSYAKAQKGKPYVKKIFTEGESFWNVVELEPGSGYVPKGMKSNYALGLHGIEVNSEEELKRSMSRYQGGGKDKKKVKKENVDLSRKKFISENEQKELGINKRYVITHKKTAKEESDRWKKLSNLGAYETIKEAEEVISDSETQKLMECGCPGSVSDASNTVSRAEGEKENEQDFMERNDGVEAGESIEGKSVVIVPKSKTISNVKYKVFEEDFLNENKAYIWDFNTGNLVNNPGYKGEKED